MNENIQEFILKLEPVLNERDIKIKRRKELIKDVNDFINLLPELNHVITDLEESFVKTNDEKVKAELDSYLKERVVYYDTIKAFTKEALDLKNELENIPEHIREFEERITRLFYQRREYEKKCEYYENQEILASDKEEKEYEESLVALEKIDEEIQSIYQFFIEQDFSKEEPLEVVEEVKDLLLPVSTPMETENLIKERDKILKSLQEIENSKGRKITYKDTYQNQAYVKKIPRHLRGKYGMLMRELKKIEKILNKEYLPKIAIEGTLFDKMSKNQKIQYLANLMLQIEAFTDKSLLPCMINGKMIPAEYKEIYEELVYNIKKLEHEKISYYRYAIDWRTYEKMDVVGKLDYIDDLAGKIINNFIDTPKTVLWNGKKYVIDEKDVSLFWKLIEMFEKINEECQNKVKELESENERILHVSNSTELETISLHNEIRTIPKTSFKEFIQNEMIKNRIESYEEKINKMVFDESYYESLDMEQKVSYCKDLINQILLKKCQNPVKLFMDGQSVEIDAKYTETFTKAVSKLFEFRKKNDSLDIMIDEEYVKTLTDEEKLNYYTLMVYDICQKPITEKTSQEIQGNMYYFDKKYALLIEVLINRMNALREKISKPVKVEKVEKPKKLDKIKKILKKKAIQIALSISALTVFAGMASSLGKQRTDIKEEIVIEDQKENDLETIAIDDVENFESTLVEPIQLDEDFILEENSKIYTNTDLNEPLSPKYQNDSYRIVAMNYQMPDKTIITVNKEDPNRQEKIENILLAGGVLQSVSGVAKSGEEDYLKNKIPTGVFDVNSINLEGDIGKQISDLVDQELGGRSR